MFLYEKKIVYLTFFWDGVKKSSAGFVKVSRERDACKLDIHIKRVDGLRDGKYALYLVLQNREAEWGNVTIKRGTLNEERSIPVRQGRIRLGEKEYDENESCGILIRLEKNQWISGFWQEINIIQKSIPNGIQDNTYNAQKSMKEETSMLESEKDMSSKQSAEKINASSPALLKQENLHAANEEVVKNYPRIDWDKEKILLRPTLGNKWEQLQRTYRSVHPFGDERLYLMIEPKDFIVLQAPYQRLVNNSFLLHGYYNYRHLILGPDEEIGNGNEICFYLGVPGTYFEREKMVAVMFGFEGFECAGAVEIGKFGYYMRRVEL